MYKVIVYLGTSRKDNYSQHVAKFVHQQLNDRPDIEAELVTSHKLGLDLSDEGESAAPKDFKKRVAEADGYILVSPEYNHGYPGTLKYMLDLNLKEYIHKPVGFVGVSSGPFGGTRMIEALVSVVRELGLVALFEDVNFSSVKDEVNEDGSLREPEKWQERLDKLTTEMLWMMGVLKYGRENVPSKHHE